MLDRDNTAGSAWLSWLADAPMFIDGQQVGDFYDAVVGPAFRTVELQLSKNRARQSEKSADVRLGATLRALFPWPQLDAGATTRRTAVASQQEGENIILQSHPLSPVPARVLRYPQEADVVGQVVGVAMRLGEWRPVEPLPGSKERAALN